MYTHTAIYCLTNFIISIVSLLQNVIMDLTVLTHVVTVMLDQLVTELMEHAQMDVLMGLKVLNVLQVIYES